MADSLGDPLETLLLHPDGRGEVRRLGSDLANGQVPQFTIPGDVYTLIGATMAPAFDYVDYRRGMRDLLDGYHMSLAIVTAPLAQSTDSISCPPVEKTPSGRT